MNQPRRTFLKTGFIASLIGGLFFKPPVVIAEPTYDDVSPSELGDVQRLFHAELTRRRLPNGEWRLCVKRGYHQHRIAQVFFDRMICADRLDQYVLQTCNVGVCLRSWQVSANCGEMCGQTRAAAISAATDYALTNLRNAEPFEMDDNASGIVVLRDGSWRFEVRQ